MSNNTRPYWLLLALAILVVHLYLLAPAYLDSEEQVAEDIGLNSTTPQSNNSTNLQANFDKRLDSSFAILPFVHEHFLSEAQADKFDKKRQFPKIVPKVPLPIFVLNIHKSGTESIAHYFNCGMGHHWANHHQMWDTTGKMRGVARCMYENLLADRPLTYGCGRYAVYTDCQSSWIQNGEPKCFYPGVHGLEAIYRHYPNATILHLPRNTTTWIKSSRHYGRFQRYNTRCQGFEPGRATNKTTDEEWGDWYENVFTKHIRDFAKARPSLTYIEGPLDETETTGKMLEEKTSCFGRHHVSNSKNKGRRI